MIMGYSFLVWNVEHFKAHPDRTEKVNDLIDHFEPDVFGILEFQAKDVARNLVQKFFDEYDFAFTDSKLAIEILVGWKRGEFRQVIYTQRREFQAGNINLRPGGLLSFRQDDSGVFDNLLFLHTDSGTEKEDYRNRQAMFEKIWHMKSAIEGLPAQQGQARFIALGDLNTMGRKKLGNIPTIYARHEIEQLKLAAQNAGMRVLAKSHERTWSTPSGSKKSELDHVIASADLQFAQETSQSAETNPFEIEVRGWNKLTGHERRDFIKNISDHCALFGEVI
jgi:hypothetical protein